MATRPRRPESPCSCRLRRRPPTKRSRLRVSDGRLDRPDRVCDGSGLGPTRPHLERSGRCRCACGFAVRRRDHGQLDRHALERRGRIRERVHGRFGVNADRCRCARAIHHPHPERGRSAGGLGQPRAPLFHRRDSAGATSLGKGDRDGAPREGSRGSRWSPGRKLDRDRHCFRCRDRRAARQGADCAGDAGGDAAQSSPGGSGGRPPRARCSDPGSSRRARAGGASSGGAAHDGRLRLSRLRAGILRRRLRHPRADVSGGWHHGEDIFAPLATPLLAVADGTVFSVGWNDIGGWRLSFPTGPTGTSSTTRTSPPTRLLPSTAGRSRRVTCSGSWARPATPSSLRSVSTRDPPRLAPRARLRRRCRPVPVPHRLAASPGRVVRRGACLPAARWSGLGARRRSRLRRAPCSSRRMTSRARAGSSRGPRSNPHRPGPEEPGRGRRPLATRRRRLLRPRPRRLQRHRLPKRRRRAPSSPGRSNPSSGCRSPSPATLSISHSRVCGPDQGL